MQLLETWEGELHVGEVDVFVGTNYRAVGAQPQPAALSSACASAANASRTCCSTVPGSCSTPSWMPWSTATFPLIDAIESELEDRRGAHLRQGHGARANIERLYDLKRKVMVTLKHAVAPLMEAVGKLTSGRVPPVCANSRDYFRDVYDHLVRINAQLETIRDTIGTAIQVSLSIGRHRAERRGEAAGRLGRDLRRGHGLRRHLGHELQGHAGTAMGIRLPDLAGRHQSACVSTCSIASARQAGCSPPDVDRAGGRGGGAYFEVSSPCGFRLRCSRVITSGRM
jgi:hypothetical protein